MSRSLRRGSIAALAALAIAPLSSCAAGNTPETLQIKPDNVSATLSPNVLLNNIVVVTPEQAAGEHAGPATVVVNIANSGPVPVELQSVTVGTGSAATFTDEKGAAVPAILVPAGGSVAIGGKGNPTAQLASASVHVGGYVPTVFTFKTGKVEAEAAVTTDKGLYKGYGPTVAPVAPAVPATTPSPAAVQTPAAGQSPAAVPTKPAGSPSARWRRPAAASRSNSAASRAPSASSRA
ncbi:DUF461 domain-containing protein [Kitasatospora sp. NPDC004240]